uniref:Granulins domain-containing protein n=1 Tax=Denticeps clupeoides TaxID=299321 RepID=A0AAY4EJ68_9TELE
AFRVFLCSLSRFGFRLVAGAVVCPDHTRCPEKNTCCETHAGYSCCIYPFVSYSMRVTYSQ